MMLTRSACVLIVCVFLNFSPLFRPTPQQTNHKPLRAALRKSRIRGGHEGRNFRSKQWKSHVLQISIVFINIWFQKRYAINNNMHPKKIYDILENTIVLCIVLQSKYWIKHQVKTRNHARLSYNKNRTTQKRRPFVCRQTESTN